MQKEVEGRKRVQYREVGNGGCEIGDLVKRYEGNN
jgi:hypothetical protein